jgi:hypothetical protein
MRSQRCSGIEHVGRAKLSTIWGQLSETQNQHQENVSCVHRGLSFWNKLQNSQNLTRANRAAKSKSDGKFKIQNPERKRVPFSFLNHASIARLQLVLLTPKEH